MVTLSKDEALELGILGRLNFFTVSTSAIFKPFFKAAPHPVCVQFHLFHYFNWDSLLLASTGPQKGARTPALKRAIPYTVY